MHRRLALACLLGLFGAAQAQTQLAQTQAALAQAAPTQLAQTATPAPPATPQAAQAPSLNARVAQLGAQVARQLAEVAPTLYDAVKARDSASARQQCARWQTEGKALDPLFAPEITDALTLKTWAQNPALYDWIVNLTHMARDLRLVVEVVCDPTPPNRAELLSAYAIISNAQALNRQVAFQLQVLPAKSP